jgi:excisionase family DNA binding protein
MQLLTYQQAAERLGFKSTKIVRDLVKSGRLRAVYPLPKSPRIADFELDNYMLSLTGQNDTCSQTQTAKAELDILLNLPSRTALKK